MSNRSISPKTHAAAIAGAVCCAAILLLVALFQVYSEFQRQITMPILESIAERLSDEGTMREALGSELLAQEEINSLLGDDGSHVKAALASKDPEERLAALIILGEAGLRAAPYVQMLIDALNDDDPEARRHAAYALGEVGPDAAPALEPLRRMADREHERVQPEAAKAIAKILEKPYGQN